MIPGQESLNDYPGPKKFLEQIEMGIPIFEKAAKIRKAIKQLDGLEETWKKLHLDYQVRLQNAEREMRDIARSKKKLRGEL